MYCNKNLVKASLMAASLLGLSFQANAADVKTGTELAPVQELVRGNGAEPSSLDPHKVDGTPESRIIGDLFEGLVSSAPDGKVVPGAASSWEIKDNTTFIFHIRDNAKWSNGDPLTANDFEYSFKRAVTPATASPYSWYFEMTAMKNAGDILNGKKSPDTLGVKAIDSKTLKITLETPLPYFVGMLSHQSTMPVHKATVEKFGDKWTRPANIVTNGAYKLSNWVVNERIEAVRNPYYWDNANTVINKVTFLPIASQNAEMNRFLADEIHLTQEMPTEFFKKLSKEHPAEVRVTGLVATYYYIFNNKKKPFDDVRVRKALSYAINRDAIAKYVMGQGQLPAYSMVPNIVDGFTPAITPWAQMTQKERDAKAVALLEEAGFDKDHPLEFDLLYNTNENHKKVAIAISSMWKKTLGVKVSLVNQEWKTYLSTQHTGDFEVTRAGWNADYNEASSMLDLMRTTHGQNHGKYSNAEFDALMDASSTATDPQMRAKNYNEADQILSNDMPIAPIYQFVTARLVKKYLGGYGANPLDKVYTKDLYFIKH